MIRNLEDTTKELEALIKIAKSIDNDVVLYTKDRSFVIEKSYNIVLRNNLNRYLFAHRQLIYDIDKPTDASTYVFSKVNLNDFFKKDRDKDIKFGNAFIFHPRAHSVEDIHSDFSQSTLKKEIEFINYVENTLTDIIKEYIESFPDDTQKVLNKKYDNDLENLYATFQDGERLAEKYINNLEDVLLKDYDNFLNDLINSVNTNNIDFFDTNSTLNEILCNGDGFKVLCLRNPDKFNPIKENMIKLAQIVSEESMPE